jgi:hypothetical protein
VYQVHRGEDSQQAMSSLRALDSWEKSPREGPKQDFMSPCSPRPQSVLCPPQSPPNAFWWKPGTAGLLGHSNWTQSHCPHPLLSADPHPPQAGRKPALPLLPDVRGSCARSPENRVQEDGIPWHLGTPANLACQVPFSILPRPGWAKELPWKRGGALALSLAAGRN